MYIYRIIFGNVLTKNNLLWLFLGLAFIIFQENLDKLFILYVANVSALSFSNSSNLDLWFGFLVIGIVYLAFLRIKQGFNPNNKETFLYFFILFAYLSFYRNDNEHIVLLELYSNPHLYYADIIIVASLLHILIWLKSIGNHYYQKLIPKINQSLFTPELEYSEQPKEASERDILKREASASHLANEIYSLYTNNAFAIGIVGGWGSGKTYFTKMVIEHLERYNPIVIEFNPWRNKSAEAITEQFFTSLKSRLNYYDGNAEAPISEYLEQITRLDKTGFADVLSRLTNGESQIEDNFQKINHIIKRTGRKVIISIDDIDRLDKLEIIEVIRLIRNTANFSNTAFLVAFDKNYVIEALKSLNQANPEKYLEKIFQVEYLLSPINPTTIRTRLVHILSSKFPGADFEQIITRPNEKEISKEPGIIDFEVIRRHLANLRDVTRFCNSFVFNYAKVKDHVEISDFFYLELLKAKFYDLYELIKNGELLRASDVNDNQLKYSLEISNVIPSQEAMDILQLLFKTNSALENSISLVSKFPLYFSQQVDDPELYQLFNQYLSQKDNLSSFEDVVFDFYLQDKSKLYQLLEYIDIKRAFTLEEFDRTVRLCIFINHLFGFEANNFDILLKFYSKSQSHKFRVVGVTENEIKEVLINSLIESIYHVVVVNLLTQTYNRPEQYVFTQDEFRNILSKFKIKDSFRNSEYVLHLLILELSSIYAEAEGFSEYYKYKVTAFISDYNYLLDSSSNRYQYFLKELEVRAPKERLLELRVGFDIPIKNSTVLSTVLLFVLKNLKATCEVLELNTIVHRISRQDFRPIWHSDKTFDLFSSNQVKHIGHDGMLYDTVEFIHVWHQEVIEKEPEFKGLLWIAHSTNLSKEEAYKGKDYNFHWDFELDDVVDRADFVKGMYCIDDLCEVILNSNQIIELSTSATGPNPKEFRMLNTSNFKNGLNSAHFQIKNISYEHAGVRVKDFKPEDNPYGLIFFMRFSYI